MRVTKRDSMTIGQLAKAAGVNVETVRYYQRRGLIEQPRKPPGSQRRYSAAVLEQLVFVRHAQQLGFSLEDAAKLQRLRPGDRRQARVLAEEKYRVLEGRIRQLRDMRVRLARFIALCKANKRRIGTLPALLAAAAGRPAPI